MKNVNVFWFWFVLLVLSFIFSRYPVEPYKFVALLNVDLLWALNFSDSKKHHENAAFYHTEVDTHGVSIGDGNFPD